jgi:hypothetical protein
MIINLVFHFIGMLYVCQYVLYSFHKVVVFFLITVRVLFFISRTLKKSSLRSEFFIYAQTDLSFAKQNRAVALKNTLFFARAQAFPSKKPFFRLHHKLYLTKKMTQKLKAMLLGHLLITIRFFLITITCFCSHCRCLCWMNGSKWMFRRRIDRVKFNRFISCINEVVPFPGGYHDSKIIISLHDKI